MWNKIKRALGFKVNERPNLQNGRPYNYGPGQRVMGPQQPRPKVQKRVPSAPPRSRSRSDYGVYNDPGLTFITNSYDSGSSSSSSDSGSSGGGCD